MPITLEYDNLTDVYNGYISSSSYVIVENGQYKTALLQVENECDVYFDGVHDASFLSIIVYDSTTLNQYHKVSDLLIYKDNGETNTLPYINNKLHVASGHYIAITVSINSDFYLYGTDLIIKKILNNDISIPETKEKTINVIKGGETFKIFIKSNNANDRYTRYTFKRMTVPSRSYDSWKLYSTDIVDKDENVIYSLGGNSEEEWEGAISEVGSSDFIGGYHGDEYYTGINCIIDGKIYSITDNFSLECNKITITVISYLNHCNTNTKVFDRVKTLVWTTDGMNIKNYYKAVDNISINRAAIGMLSADKKYNNETQIDKMKNNYMGIIEDIPLNNTAPYGTMIEPNQAFIKGTFFGQNVYISAIMKNYELTSHNYQGMFVDFVDRMKIYLEPIRNYEMSIGEYFMCETFYEIFAID